MTVRIASASPSITFEENRGQAPADVRFLSHMGSRSVLLMRDGTVITGANNTVVRMRLVGAKAAAPLGLDRLPAKSNYLIGSDPANWRSGIANYARVLYAHAYPRTDVIWHGRGSELEYDFEIAPGADPRRIRLKFEGAPIALSRNRELVAGLVRLRAPRAFQDGREIECRYELHGRTVQFRTGAYDRTRPLTIDPVLSFSTLLGGSDRDDVTAVRVDANGNIFVAGTTLSPDFPVSPGALQAAPPGGSCNVAHETARCPNVFVTKFAPGGSTLLFSTYIGGQGPNSLAAMTIDAAGNMYLTGIPGSHFPKLTPLPGYAVDSQAGYYVAKLSADGASLLYATQLPIARPSSSVSGIAVDGAGSVYLTGSSNRGVPAVNALQSAPRLELMFRTSDSGRHWQGLIGDLPIDLVETVAIDPRNPRTLYLGMDRGLYKSTDEGSHWVALLTGSPPQAQYPESYLAPSALAVDPTNSQVIYLGTLLNGAYKSTDAGASWVSAGTGAARFVREFAINPANTATLYMATDAGLYKSTNGASTWTPTGLMAGPDERFFVSKVVVDPSAPDTLYAGTARGVMKSLNAGATWTAMNTGFLNSTDITNLTIDPVNPQILYAATTVNHAPYRTLDGGAHWTQGQWPVSQYVECLLVDPLVHTTVWAGSPRGLLVSRDSGATWSLPATQLPQIDVQALAAGSTGVLYAINNGVVMTDAFAIKLDPTGAKIVYSTYLGGTGWDFGQGIAVDSAGRAYVTGFTDSFDFPTANPVQAQGAGARDAFVSVLDPTGAKLIWSTYLGGSGEDQATAIVVDPAGNVHIAGRTQSVDLPLQNASQKRLGGDWDGFAAKLKGDGSALMFATYVGGSRTDIAYAVGADSAGNTYVAGATDSGDLATRNAIQPELAGISNAFIAAWNDQNGTLQFLTYLGGRLIDGANAISLGPAGSVFVVGSTTSRDFPRKYAFQDATGGNGDVFLSGIAPDGSGPKIALAAVTDAASYGTAVAPGEIVSLFGAYLAIVRAGAEAAPIPVQLADVQVKVDGIAAPLFFVSFGQINAQIPFETAPGRASVLLTSSAGTATLPIQVMPAAPAVFTLNLQGTGTGAIEHGLTGELVTNANPASPGEIVAIFCTGLGAVEPKVATGAAAPVPPPRTRLTPRVLISGREAPVSYAGLAPGFAGLYQINVQVPPDTPSGAHDLKVAAGGITSNSVFISVR